MADHSSASNANKGKGAAEEPEAERSSTAASYDRTVFQRPHPDDRGGADGTPRKKGNGKVKSKDKAQGKTKDGKGKTVGRCGNCDAEGAKMKCSQCGTEVYCDEKCQRVRGGRVSARGGGAMAATPAALSRPPHRPHPPHAGALAVRRPQEGVQGLRARRHRPRAAAAAVQEGGRDS